MEGGGEPGKCTMLSCRPVKFLSRGVKCGAAVLGNVSVGQKNIPAIGVAVGIFFLWRRPLLRHNALGAVRVLHRRQFESIKYLY